MNNVLNCVILATCLTFICCNAKYSAKVHNIFKRAPSKDEFDMLISEEGWIYTEKITFDASKKTVVHDVPAHRNLTASNVMDDFLTNSTITRFLGQRVCYIRPKTPQEPTLEILKKSMEMVASQKHKMEPGFRKISTHWMITGRADLSKLSDDVMDFCRGFDIYDVEEYRKDGASVINALSRKKRSEHYVLCRPWTEVRLELNLCPRATWVLKCKFTTQNCFHYVTCTGTVVELRAGTCTSTHKYDDFTCCTPACP